MCASHEILQDEENIEQAEIEAVPSNKVTAYLKPIIKGKPSSFKLIRTNADPEKKVTLNIEVDLECGDEIIFYSRKIGFKYRIKDFLAKLRVWR